METNVQKTARPVAAGILTIIPGAFNLMGVIGIIIAIIVLDVGTVVTEQDIYPLTIGFINAILAISAVYLAVLGILSIIGGVYATQRKKWGMALTGAITATLSSLVLGIIAIVLVAISKSEFE